MCVCAGVCVPLRALRANRMASLGPSSRSVRQPKEKLSPNRVRRMSSEGFLKSATAGGVYLVTSIYGTTMKETDADMYIQFLRGQPGSPESGGTCHSTFDMSSKLFVGRVLLNTHL